MKKCFFKVYKNINDYKSEEFKILALKLLLKNNRQIKYNNNKIKIKSYYKTFCFDLGVKRSVYNFFNLSRWALKHRASKAEVCGLKKISW